MMPGSDWENYRYYWKRFQIAALNLAALNENEGRTTAFA
jgi:hypothetical protein